MKQLLLFMMLFFPISANANEKETTKQNEINSKVVCSKSTSVRARHAPAIVHLLLFIEDNSITIHFNGDFGLGFYQILDNESGISVSGSVNAEPGGSEFVAFPITSVTSFDFDIEFEDGSWSHLTWGN